jgi:hypothetical protein
MHNAEPEPDYHIPANPMLNTTHPADASPGSAFCIQPSALVPYKSGTRISRSTGDTILIFEFKLCSKPKETTAMDMIETYIANAIIKALHSSHPTLTADDDAKVTKAVTDFVTTTMDLVGVYFTVRNAKK